MSTMTTTESVEFERREVHLSSDEETPLTIHGVALGEGDVTRGTSGIKKKWPEEELRKAASTLEGKNLVEDHNNSSRGVVGLVTKAGYKDGVGVIYEAELYDEELTDNVKNGLLEVSIRGYHNDVDEMEETEDGAKVVENIQFDNLSIVPQGASPSNTLEVGEHAELSAAELAEFTKELDSNVEENIAPENFMFQSEDRAIEKSKQLGLEGAVHEMEVEGVPYYMPGETHEQFLAAYMETAGELSSLPESLSRHLMDREISMEDQRDMQGENPDGEPHNDESEEEDEDVPSPPDWQDGMVVQWQVEPQLFGKIVHVDERRQIVMVEIHEMKNGELIPTGFTISAGFSDIQKFERRSIQSGHKMKEEEEMAAEGEKVQWDSSGGMARGVIVDRQTEGCFNSEIDGDVEVCADEGDAALLINVVQEAEDGKWEKSGTMVAHKESTVEETDFSMLATSENMSLIEEGMVFYSTLNDSRITIESVDGNMITASADDDDGSWQETREDVLEKIAQGEWEHSGHVEENAERYDDYPDAASENAQMALDAREETGNPNDCGTDVGWKRANQLANGESLTRDQVAKMSAFNRHRQNSDMSDEEGESDCGWMMWKAWGGDEGVDWADQKLDEIDEEMSQADASGSADELQAMHKPEWSSTADKEWNSPDLEDFGDMSWEDMSGDERMEIANHFLVSKTGEMPPERFSDLALPVVEPDGTLNLNALANAKARAGQVDGLSEEDVSEIEGMIDDLANDNFEDASFGEEEMASTVPNSGVSVLTSDDFRRRYKTGESEMDSIDYIKPNTTMTELSEELQARIEELEDPTVVDEPDLEELREKAEQYDDISEDISELRERTEVLDEVDRSLVEELSDSDDPVVIESSRLESLSAEAEQVKQVYASNLADEIKIFSAEELMEKNSIEELREKHEEHLGELEEELSPDPSGVDTPEPDEPSEEEELSDEIAAKQEALKQKIVNSGD